MHARRLAHTKKRLEAKWRLTESGTGRQRVGAMRGSAAAGRLRVLSRTLLAKVQTQTPLMLGAETHIGGQREAEPRERESYTERKEKESM